MKKIGVVTSSRADYGILEPLLNRLEKDSNLNLFVTGSHFEESHGNTYSQIQGKFKHIHQIPVFMNQTGSEQIAETLARVQVEFEKALKQHRPDILVLLGDRIELMPIALCASLLHIPIAHIHGGELTYGAIDESVRHALTKFSHLHFTSCEEYRKRVIQLGENPERVFNVGSIALDTILKTQLMSKADLESDLKIQLRDKNLVITLHPETLENESYQIQMVDNLLSCLSELSQNYFVLFTATNADLYGSIINDRIQKYVQSHSNTKFIESLGTQRYFSILKIFDACIGNSSSGIIEAPSFGIPTLNIGKRQAGRVRAQSVIDVSIHIQEMQEALKKVLQQRSDSYQNPYFKAGTVTSIAKRLVEAESKEILNKQFFDINMDGL